jgi:hypothetical protein
MALGPTQLPIQWVPGTLSLLKKQPGHEADHSPPSSAKVKECMELYLHSPNTPSWHGAQLKERTGMPLPLPLPLPLPVPLLQFIKQKYGDPFHCVYQMLFCFTKNKKLLIHFYKKCSHLLSDSLPWSCFHF